MLSITYLLKSRVSIQVNISHCNYLDKLNLSIKEWIPEKERLMFPARSTSIAKIVILEITK